MLVTVGKTDFEVTNEMTESEIELAMQKAISKENERVQEEVYYGQ